MKVGIIGAMDVEVARLAREMTVEREMERAGMHFWEGRLGGTEAVVVRCGIGKVSAGICVQILCDLFGITHVINTGIAGSLDEEINIGDVVVSIDAMYHDMDVTALGYEFGQVPQVATLSFAADEMLRKEAVRACSRQGVQRGGAGDRRFRGTRSQRRPVHLRQRQKREHRQDVRRPVH